MENTYLIDEQGNNYECKICKRRARKTNEHSQYRLV